jgi:hypothetical protein
MASLTLNFSEVKCASDLRAPPSGSGVYGSQTGGAGEARGEERLETGHHHNTRRATCGRRANFTFSFSGIAVPVIYAAGEPKGGPLIHLLCSSTPTLGVKDQKTIF